MNHIEQNLIDWDFIVEEAAALIDMDNKHQEQKIEEDELRKIIEANPISHPGEANDELVERLKREAEKDRIQRCNEIAVEWETHPERKQAFLDGIRQENNLAKIDGFFEGWWELDEDGNMAAPPFKFKISDFPENAMMAHVVTAAGIFPSVSQARKNGHNKPLVAGEFVLTKKKIRIIIIDE